MTIESSLYKRNDPDRERINTAEKLDTGVEEPGVSCQQDESLVFLPDAPSGAYDLSVVVPTRNERGNIWPLLESLRNALRGVRVEVIFVDDSDDDTPAVINHAIRMMACSHFRIRLEHRSAGSARAGGLATAVVQGLQETQAAYVAVLDADLQHPPEQLRVMYDQATAQHADLVIASRYIKGGSYRGLDGAGRRYISLGMKWIARLLFPEQLWRLSDPLGGFFLLRRSLLDDVSLRPIGYKILLEILIRCRWQHALEVPYHFQARIYGQSKANMRQGMLALKHMLRLWREVPAAGRIWKIGLLLLLNLLITWVLVQINQFFPGAWDNLPGIVFGVMVCLNFILFSRFLFPSRRATNRAVLHPAYQVPVEEHPVPIEERDTVELPSLASARTEPIDLQQDAQPEGKKNEPDRLLPLVSMGVVILALGWIGVMVCLDLALFGCFLFPSRRATNRAALHHPSQVPIEERDTVEPSSSASARISATDSKQHAQPAGKKNASDRLLPIVSVAVVILALGWIIYAQPGALLIPAALFIGTALAFTRALSRDQAIRIVLSIAVGVATVDYLSWRIVATNWQGWWIAVPLLCAEVFGAIHVLGFQFTVWPWTSPKIEASEDPTQFPIFVFIPTVNEGASILRPTLEGIIVARDRYLARYPHGRVTIVVCNDGRVAQAPNWQETERLAKELGVCCVTRTTGGGAKAGNIEHARHEVHATGDALLVIFDADQVAKPDFLLKTTPPFGDPKMGWVQTGQYYANLDNPVSRWADDQQSMFYNLLCPGKAALDAAFICGTNVVMRAAALDEIGGLPQDSVTEDFAASIALHPRWRSVYLTDILATGLGPLDIPSYLKQQGRWALGTLGVFRTHWREILLPRKQGLRLGQRVQYFLACTHYLCGLRDLIYLISPILFIFTGIPAVRSAYLSDYLWHFLPYCLLGIAALWYSARGVTGLRGIIIGFGSFPVLIGSLLSVILQRKVSFAVTSKQRRGKRSLSYLGVYCFFFLLCVAGLLWAAQVRGQEQAPLFISMLWVIYSMLMLGSFLWLSFKDIRFQTSTQQSRAASRASVYQPYPSKLDKRRRGLNPVWNLGWAAVVACPILVSGTLSSLPFFAINLAAPFNIGQEQIAAPYFGVSLPVQLLQTRPPLLERDLDTQFTIIGRTQDVVHDHFDTHWADQLAARGARPWITLQFGVFGPNQTPSLDANLPAIINGLHDQELTQWAEEIRAYDKPVYLTILLHVDRNWSLSSAVANGGIPQDVPKAWTHVQSVFRAAGARNVAWVWAPADPIHDQPYAPPASTIDAVLQSFINYPGTVWGDPQKILQQLHQRYPTKPLFVEASADGPAAQKAAWLEKLGQAINSTPSVYALLYHEGGPDLNPTRAEIESWSLASDPDSLAAMRHILSSLARERFKTSAPVQAHLAKASHLCNVSAKILRQP